MGEAEHVPVSPWDLPADWPAPDAAARAGSEALVERIRERMAAAGGSLAFAEYMQLALYAPGLGYYSAGATKFGAAGDFVTAPEISPLFSACLAQTCAALLEQLPGAELLELGAGSGVMARDILAELIARGCPPRRYCILETSAELRQRQHETLAASRPEVLDRVVWLDAPPAGFTGMVLANEVLDALPVRLIRWREGRAFERHLVWQAAGFAWEDRPLTGPLADKVGQWAVDHAWPADYLTECPAWLDDWLAGLAAGLKRGAMLFIDYGYPRRAYYHAQRAGGTLMCHYRHRAHPEPRLLPGLQDITAHVDFTAVAEAADAAGLQVAGMADQAHLLMDTGIEARAAGVMQAGTRERLAAAQQIRQLMLPGEMGERFKAMLLTRDVATPLPGFGQQDLRFAL